MKFECIIIQNELARRKVAKEIQEKVFKHQTRLFYEIASVHYNQSFIEVFKKAENHKYKNEVANTDFALLSDMIRGNLNDLKSQLIKDAFDIVDIPKVASQINQITRRKFHHSQFDIHHENNTPTVLPNDFLVKTFGNIQIKVNSPYLDTEKNRRIINKFFSIMQSLNDTCFTSNMLNELSGLYMVDIPDYNSSESNGSYAGNKQIKINGERNLQLHTVTEEVFHAYQEKVDQPSFDNANDDNNPVGVPNLEFEERFMEASYVYVRDGSLDKLQTEPGTDFQDLIVNNFLDNQEYDTTWNDEQKDAYMENGVKQFKQYYYNIYGKFHPYAGTVDETNNLPKSALKLITDYINKCLEQNS